MKTIAALFGLIATLFLAAPAAAVPSPSASAAPLCSGWYVNPDESDRKPTQLDGGMKFEPADLVHRAVVGLTVADLKPGTFTASPSPDQPSFFSVEVGDPGTYAGYATLRWNTTTSKWNMVTGGTLHEHASPAELVKLTTPAKSSNVLSFGVGYTKNPPGTVTTVVKSVTFGGKVYDLSCAPKPSASASSSASADPSPSSSTSTEAAAGLPVTGDNTGLLIGVGAVVLLTGAVLFFAARRRTRFTA